MSDLPTLIDWRRLNERITTSGQPTQAQLAELKALGVTQVINLALHSHEKALPDEAGSLAALGMAYTHIPVEFSEPTEDDFAKFCAAMEASAGQRLHVHCIANLRVSAFLYRWQRDVCGMADEDARALMDSVWQPGGVWAAFIGEEASEALPHRGPR